MPDRLHAEDYGVGKPKVRAYGGELLLPVSLLTDAERTRLAGFPKEVPTEDLHAHFTLTGRDRGRSRRGACPPTASGSPCPCAR